MPNVERTVMAGPLPDGEAAPRSGELPPAALEGVGRRGFGLYLHVPFCAARCGYCDFNTYTAAELGAEPGASQEAYLAAVRAELALAADVLGPDLPEVSTVFFGGGTPTLLDPDALTGLLAAAKDAFPFASGCEVTTEANPESVTAESLGRLREGGINRVSFGMQSAVPAVLRILDRVHSPGRAAAAVGWARDAGFDSVSLDLIYGTPGESLADWTTSVEAAVAAAPDHVSAYSLIVEQGTRLAHRVAHGELPAPDEDDLADKYVVVDDLLSAAGLHWYEVSNWARPGHACRHNLGYWRSDDWWGIGPGAHSHVGGVRWWNVRHPRDYSASLLGGAGLRGESPGGESPAVAREVLTPGQRLSERVLLEIRLAEGLDPCALPAAARERVAGLEADGLLTGTDPLVLSRRGRLLADLVVRELL
jgi:oxygen-independent coproporphyrinogen-3 oxidase